MVTLSAFAGTFSLACGVRLLGAEEEDDAPAELIGELVSKSLIAVELKRAGLRYRLLGATRAYAREKLSLRDDRHLVLRAHAVVMISTLESTGADLTRLSPKAWAARYLASIDDVRSAADWLATRVDEKPLLIRILAMSAPLWFQTANVREYRDRARDALAGAAACAETANLSCVWSSLGHAHLHMEGPDETSRRAFQRAAELAEGAHDDARSMVCRGWWMQAVMEGRYGKAIAEACRHGHLAGDVDAVAVSDRMLLVSLHGSGRHVQAGVHGERVLASILLATETGPRASTQVDNEANAKIGMARVLWLRGLPRQALAMAREAVSVARTASNDLTICVCLHGLALIALWTHELEDANAATVALSQLAASHAMPYWMAWGRCLKDALSFLEGGRVRADWREPLCGIRQLEIMLTLGTEFLEPDLQARSEAGETNWCEPEVLRARGCRVMQLGTAQSEVQAIDLFERALSLARDHGALVWELRCAMSLAEIFLRRSQHVAAWALLTRTLDKFVQGPPTPDQLRAQRLLRPLEPA